MTVSILALLVANLYRVSGYDNLALGKPSTMSGDFYNFEARLANNGDKTNNYHMHENSCAHTQIKEAEVWWQVDLEDIYPITNIGITYRDGFANRFAGFSIFVSNTSTFKNGEECYHYTSPELPPLIKNWTCLATGRYVTIFNERRRGEHYPSSYSTKYGAILELCEVEVFGCPHNKYGESCENRCFCSNFTCDYETGICQDGCKKGHMGDNCNTCVDAKRYGENCEKECGYCKLDVNCEAVYGVCPAGCKTGWQPSTCTEVCKDGTFGPDCSQECGSCLNGEPCHHVNGTCLNGCSPGFMGNLCKEECDPGTFGDGCHGKCGQCKKYTVCDSTNGNCVYGCEDGWQRPSCTNICQNDTYGRNCNNKCGSCMNDEPCDHITGICRKGCKAGFLGEKCDKVCERGNHGLDCKDNCGNCYKDEACHHSNGSCPHGCEPGWQEPLCVTCVPGYFGPECLDKCGHCFNEVPCDQVTGECLNGCKDGWNGSKCEYKVVYSGIRTIYIKQTNITSVVIPCIITVLVIFGCIIIVWKIYRKKQTSDFKLLFNDIQKIDDDKQKGLEEENVTGGHDNAYEGWSY